MKGTLAIIGIVVVIIVIIAFAVSNYKKGIPPVDNSKNELFLTIVKKEPKVKDAVITDILFLYASVVDDQTNRNGYADYMCQLAKDNGANITKVKIVDNMDVIAQKSQSNWRVLGEAWCK